MYKKMEALETTELEARARARHVRGYRMRMRILDKQTIRYRVALIIRTLVSGMYVGRVRTLVSRMYVCRA